MSGIALPIYPEFQIYDDPSVSQKWSDWLEGLEVMLAAMRVSDDEEKMSLFRYYLGSDGRKLLKTFSSADQKDFKSASKALTGYFSPAMNDVFLMTGLLQEKQESGESMNVFYRRVLRKAEYLALEKKTAVAIKELVVLTQLVNNCLSSSLKKKAIRDGMSLDKFLKEARTIEQTDYQFNKMGLGESESNQVNKVNWRKNNGYKRMNEREVENEKRNPTSKGDYKEREKFCERCGYREHAPSSPCPAIGQACNRCGKYNHFSRVCNRQPERRPYESKADVKRIDGSQVSDSNDFCYEEEVNTQSDDDAYVFMTKAETGQHPLADIEIGSEKISCIIDTGAQVNILDMSAWRRLGSPRLLLPSKHLYAYGSESSQREIPVLGRCVFQVKAGITGKSSSEEFHIVKGATGSLVGCDTAVRLGLVAFANVIASDPYAQLLKDYADRFEGIGKLKDVQVKLHIDDSVQPRQQRTRRVPFHLRDQVEQELQTLMEQDIIEPATGPTDWVSPLHVIQKEKGVRLTIDSRYINKAIKRYNCTTMPTVEDLMHDLSGANIFSKIDLNKSYFQLELDEDSRPITTFSSHIGNFRFKRLGMGINCASEVFQKAIADMLHDIPNVKNIADDVLIWNVSAQEHLVTLRRLFERLRENNVTVNYDKCVLGKSSVEFFGHTFSGQGVSASESKVRAILDAHPPNNRSELVSLLCSTQYISRFVPNYSFIVYPLREIAKPSEKFVWGEKQTEAFQRLKDVFRESKVLHYFDVSLPVEVVVDASPVGVAGLLLQKTEKGVNIVAMGSRSMSDVESRYSQTERECLAVVWACEYFHVYLCGAEHFTVISDHKPLEGILNNPRSHPTARLERMILRLLPYTFTIVYRPGKWNPADFYSRHPVKENVRSSSHRSWIDKQVERAYIRAVSQFKDVKLSLDAIREATKDDPELNKVLENLKTQQWQGEQMRPYKLVREEISSVDGLLLRCDRIIIPQNLRRAVIERAHRGHQGICKTKAFVRETAWFPGVDSTVEEAVRNCLACQASIDKHDAAPLVMSELPDSPWLEVSVDFTGPMKSGEYIMVVLDEYSRFPEVEIIHSLTTDVVTRHLETIFSRHGCPACVKSDNGAPFSGAQFKEWCQQFNIHHRKITPLWPAGNGECERFMRSIKKAMRTSVITTGNWRTQLQTFLRHYRATPHSSTNVSPAELLFGRKIRTELPKLPPPRVENSSLRKCDADAKLSMKENAERRRRSIHVAPEVGSLVLVRQQEKGKLIPPFNPTPYRIIAKKGTMLTAKSSDGHITTRNVSFFKTIPEGCVSQPVQDMDDGWILDPSPVEEAVPVPPEPQARPNIPERRPDRVRKPPTYLNDYIVCA